MAKKRRRLRKIGKVIKRVAVPSLNAVMKSSLLGFAGAFVGNLLGSAIFSQKRNRQNMETMDLSKVELPPMDDVPKIEGPKKRKFLEGTDESGS